MPLGGYDQEPTPENLALRARQVGQPGLGMAQPQQQAPLINPRENPLGAAGLVLGDVAAGLRGQPLRSDKLQQQRMQEQQMSMEQQQLQMRSAEIAMRVAEQYATVFDHTKPEEQDAVLNDTDRFSGAMGGMNIKPLIKSLAKYKGEQRQIRLAAARELGADKNPAVVALLADNPELLDKVAEKTLTTAPPEKKPPTKISHQEGDTNIDSLFAPDNPKADEFGLVEVGRGPKSQQSTTVNIGEDAFKAATGKGAGDILSASQAAASGGLDSIANGKQILEALDSGKVTAGPGTSYITWAKQLVGGNQEALNQNRAVVQGLAKYVLANRGQLKGQGSVSNIEQELLEKASSEKIDNLSIGEIRTLVKLNDRSSRYLIQKHKALLATARKSKDPLDVFDVEEPAAAAAATGGTSGRFKIEQVGQ